MTAANPNSRDVFIIHGRDLPALDRMTQCLRSMDLRPFTYDDVRATSRGTLAIHEAVMEGLTRATATIAILTPDERVVLDPDLSRGAATGDGRERWHPRQNVINEIGLAIGRFGKGKIILLRLSRNVELPSDHDGMDAAYFSGSVECRQSLSRRLTQMGCAVTLSADWTRAGDFEALRRSRAAYADRPAPARRDAPAEHESAPSNEALLEGPPSGETLNGLIVPSGIAQYGKKPVAAHSLWAPGFRSPLVGLSVSALIALLLTRSDWIGEDVPDRPRATEGMLQVEGASNAVVIIDGGHPRNGGTPDAPLELLLPEGLHSVKFMRPDRTCVVRRVDIFAGEVRRIENPPPDHRSDAAADGSCRDAS